MARLSALPALDVVNCCFKVDLLARELGWLRRDSALGQLLWIAPLAYGRQGIHKFAMNNEGMAACLTILRELQSEDASRTVEVIARLLLFLGTLARHLPLSAERQQTAIHPVIMEVLHWLETDLATNWRIAELSRRAHIAPAYLIRLFKAHIGLTPIEYLTYCRVQKAAMLLLQTTDPIATIGAQVGWDDPN